MKLLSWLTDQFSHRHRAMWQYQRGMIRAKLRDHASAVADYTAVIDMQNTPADIRAMALYNRSVAYTASHNESGAISDLEKLLKMAGAPANLRAEARRKLVPIQTASDRLEASRNSGTS